MLKKISRVFGKSRMDLINNGVHENITHLFLFSFLQKKESVQLVYMQVSMTCSREWKLLMAVEGMEGEEGDGKKTLVRHMDDARRREGE